MEKEGQGMRGREGEREGETEGGSKGERRGGGREREERVC